MSDNSEIIDKVAGKGGKISLRVWGINLPLSFTSISTRTYLRMVSASEEIKINEKGEYDMRNIVPMVNFMALGFSNGRPIKYRLIKKGLYKISAAELLALYIELRQSLNLPLFFSIFKDVASYRNVIISNEAAKQ